MGKIVKDKNANVNAEDIELYIQHDQKTLLQVFEKFNHEFFEDKLDIPKILIELPLREMYSIKMPEGWVKNNKHDVADNGEKKKGSDKITMAFSAKLFRSKQKDIYITLLRAMIAQWNEEMRLTVPDWKLLINNGRFSIYYYNECTKRGLKIDNKHFNKLVNQKRKSENNKKKEREKNGTKNIYVKTDEKIKDEILSSGKCRMKGCSVFNSVYKKEVIDEKRELLYKNNEVIHLNLIKEFRDVCGDLESFIIEDKDNKRMQVGVEQVRAVLLSGKAEIEGLGLTPKNHVKVTRRPKTKTISKERKELENLQKKIDKLENSEDEKDRDKYYQLKDKYEKLIGTSDKYYKAHEAIQRHKLEEFQKK